MKVLFVIFALSVSFSASAGWLTGPSGTGELTSITKEVYRTTEEGGYPTFVQTNIASANCGGTTWVLRSTLDDADDVYSALLTAFVAQKSVVLYEWTCIKVDGVFYPRIGGIKINR